MRQIAAAGTPVPAPKPLHRRGARFAWLSGAAAMTSALAATFAFAFAPGTTQPDQATQVSGQQILLAAATVAEDKPAGTGAYWHVKKSDPVPSWTDGSTRMQILNEWTAHDGTEYVMPENATGVFQTTKRGGFQVGASHLTYGQLEQLPTDPAALKAWITDSFSHPSGQGALKADISAEAMPGRVANSLSQLLWAVPAPPAVRAAALRALASMPSVTNLGPMDGGQALRISFPPPPTDNFPNGKLPAGAGEIRLVIDPETSMLLSQTNYQGTFKILTAEWTNEMPKVVQAPPKPAERTKETPKAVQAPPK
jgi:hypothetical protein